jgi:hypothetical protein
LQLRSAEPLQPIRCSLVKIATYVPTGFADVVWQAMADAGAGHIGKYSHCSFQAPGIGTYLPEEGAVPFIGIANRLTTTDEIRIETIAPATLSKRIVEALIKAHPYEEVAYDLYPLQNEVVSGGLGRVGNLDHPISLEDFAARLKEVLPITHVRLVGNPALRIERVAVCGGSGMDLVELAKLSGAQVYVTGDIRYHDALTAKENGLCLIDAGHFGTEFPALSRLQHYLRDSSVREGWGCEFEITQQQTDIWQWL